MRSQEIRRKIGCTLLSLCLFGASAMPVLADENSMAGMSSLLGGFMESADSGETDVKELVLANSSSNDISVTHGLAISKVEDYVNIRTDATTDSEVVGKIYDQCGAAILDAVQADDGVWYYVRSGSVEGYIRSDFVVTGEEAQDYARQNGNLFMNITEDGIFVREEANTDCGVVDLLAAGDSLTVIGETEDFVQVLLEDDSTGYISKDYVDVYIDCDTAISLEEEAEMLAELARQEEEERLRKEKESKEAAEAAYAEYLREQEASKAAEEAAYAEYLRQQEEQQAYYEEPAYEEPAYEEPAYEEPAYEEPAYEEPAAEEPAYEEPAAEEPAYEEPAAEEPAYEEPSYSLSWERQAVVDYAWSKVGCDYVWGAEGPWSFDCSGLVKCAYAQAGVSLYHQSGVQGSAGSYRSVGDAQPGDILWKSGHVGIYVGDGMCIHASTYGVGVICSDVWSCGWVCARNVLG